MNAPRLKVLEGPASLFRAKRPLPCRLCHGKKWLVLAGKGFRCPACNDTDPHAAPEIREAA